MNRESFLELFHKLLQAVPYLGIVSSIAVLSLIFVAGLSQKLLICAAMLLIPVIVVSAVFIWRKKSVDMDLETIENSGLFCLNISPGRGLKIYCILLGLLTTWLLISGTRDALFLILIMAMYAVSIIQIFAKRINVVSILSQLTVTSLISALTRQFCYYYYYNTGDSFAHSQTVSSILYFNGLPPVELRGGYADFFFFHISSAITSLLSSVFPIHATYLTATIPIILGVVFVFCLARYLTKSDRIALLASVCYLFIPVVYNYAVRAAPRTLTTLAFLILLCMFFSNKEWKTWVVSLISTVVAIYMILVHHAQLPIMMVVMTLILVTYLVYFKRLSRNQLVVTLLFYFIPISYYLYTYLGSMIGILERNFFGTISTVSITATPELASENLTLYTVIYNMASAVIVSLILFGIFYLTLSRNKAVRGIVLMPIGLLLFAPFLPGVTDVIPMLSSMHQMDRFQIVVAPIFAVIMGLGALIFLKIVSSNKRQIQRCSCIMVIVLLLVFGVGSVVFQSSNDSTAFSGTVFQGDPNWFNYDDYQLFNWVNDYVPVESVIYAEFVPSRFFGRSSSHRLIELSDYTIPTGMKSFFHTDDAVEYDTFYLLFRENMFQSYGLYVAVGKGSYATKQELIEPSAETELSFKKNSWDMGVVYDVGNSQLFYHL